MRRSRRAPRHYRRHTRSLRRSWLIFAARLPARRRCRSCAEGDSARFRSAGRESRDLSPEAGARAEHRAAGKWRHSGRCRGPAERSRKAKIAAICGSGGEHIASREARRPLWHHYVSMLAIELVSVVALLVWIYLLAARGGFWRMRVAAAHAVPAVAKSIAVVIPARDEAAVIG